MYDYIVKELPQVLASNLPIVSVDALTSQKGWMGSTSCGSQGCNLTVRFFSPFNVGYLPLLYHWPLNGIRRRAFSHLERSLVFRTIKIKGDMLTVAFNTIITVYLVCA